MSDFKQDDYMSTVLAANRGLVSTHVAGRSDAELYASGGLFKKVVDVPAEQAMSKGFGVSNDDGIISSEVDRLNVVAHVTDALRWASLFGGAAIVLIARDGGDLLTPLNIGALEQIEELRVFDIGDIQAGTQIYNNSKDANFGTPVYYEVSLNGSGIAKNSKFYMHESRLITFSGDPMPRKLNNLNIPWAGLPSIKGVYEAICDYRSVLMYARECLKRKQQAVNKMHGLGAAVQNRGDAEIAIQKRISMVDLGREIRNTIAIDSEDDYTIFNNDLSGIPQLIQEFQINVASQSGLSVVRLFGRSPGGLNSSGSADIDNDNSLFDAVRAKKAKPPLERLVSLICAQKTIKSKAPESWEIEWPALKQMTEKEEIEIGKIEAEVIEKKMNAVLLALDSSVIDEKEARAFAKQERLFGLKDESDSSAATAYAQTAKA